LPFGLAANFLRFCCLSFSQNIIIIRLKFVFFDGAFNENVEQVLLYGFDCKVLSAKKNFSQANENVKSW